MKSTNLHSSSHHLQDHVVETSVIPTSLVFSSINVADNYFLNNNNNIHATCDEASQNSYNNPMIQDLRFPLPHQNNINISIIQPSFHHDNQHLISNNIIKEESSTSSDQSNSSSFQTFSEMLSPSTTTTPTYKNQMIFQPLPFQQSMQFQSNDNIIDDNINNNNNNNNSINNNNNLPTLGGLSRGNNTTFSQIFPSVNISKLSLTSTTTTTNNNNNNKDNNYSSEFGNGLDLFSRENLMGGGSHNQASNSNFLELLKGGSHYGVNHDLQPSNDLKLCNHSTNNNHSSFDNNGVVEPKSSRPSCIVEPIKSTHQSPSNKKQRFETRPSCPPFKVRKEKLGDRIAALQQLVAPFGKTDTASVLIEAIGYIKFLHSQVETLSAPYMKLALRNKNSQIHQRISEEPHENEVTKQGLRSRGLCLVPLTCMSYIATDFEINGGIWPPYNSYPDFTL